jgi:hypothetical protein
LQRIYRGIPLSGDQDNGLAVRDFGCWISIRSSPQDLGAVTVHTGKQVVGTLTEADSSVARRVLSTQNRNAIAVTAAAWGDSREDAVITVGLPTVPDTKPTPAHAAGATTAMRAHV